MFQAAQAKGRRRMGVYPFFLSIKARSPSAERHQIRQLGEKCAHQRASSSCLYSLSMMGIDSRGSGVSGVHWTPRMQDPTNRETRCSPTCTETLKILNASSMRCPKPSYRGAIRAGGDASYGERRERANATVWPRSACSTPGKCHARSISIII